MGVSALSKVALVKRELARGCRRGAYSLVDDGWKLVTTRWCLEILEEAPIKRSAGLHMTVPELGQVPLELGQKASQLVRQLRII